MLVSDESSICCNYIIYIYRYLPVIHLILTNVIDTSIVNPVIVIAILITLSMFLSGNYNPKVTYVRDKFIRFI